MDSNVRPQWKWNQLGFSSNVRKLFMHSQSDIGPHMAAPIHLHHSLKLKSCRTVLLKRHSTASQLVETGNFWTHLLRWCKNMRLTQVVYADSPSETGMIPVVYADSSSETGMIPVVYADSPSETGMIPVVYADSASETGQLKNDLQTVSLDGGTVDTWATAGEDEGALDTATATAEEPVASDQEVEEYIANETGRQRVHDFLFRKIEYASHPKLLLMKMQMTAIGLAMFVVYGRQGQKEATAKFLEKYKAKQFISRVEGMRLHKYTGMQAFIRRGMYYTFVGVTFVCLFNGLPNVICVYRNKNNLADYLIGGGLAGCLLRMHVGPRAMLAGSTIGAIMGLAYGVIVYAPVLFGWYPTQQELHKRYIKRYLSVEKRYEPPAEYKQTKRFTDEQGFMPLKERGIRLRKRVRTSLGLSTQPTQPAHTHSATSGLDPAHPHSATSGLELIHIKPVADNLNSQPDEAKLKPQG